MTKLLLIITICLLLAACTAQEAATEYDITAYLDSFAAMDYAAMFEYVMPTADIDEAAFITKYDAIFSGLGVTDIVLSDVAGPDEDGGYTYTATYKTADYGDFVNEYCAESGGHGRRMHGDVGSVADISRNDGRMYGARRDGIIKPR